MPNPIDPVDSECVDSYGGLESRQCISYWLCTEDSVDENCRCIEGGASPGLRGETSYCAQITCPPGSVCDSVTGACKSYGQEQPDLQLPGIFPGNPIGPEL